MTLKQLTLGKLRKLVFACKKSKKQYLPNINELNLVITDNPKDKKTYENITFLYSGTTHIYRRKNLKKYTHTMKDYKNVEIVTNWLENRKNQPQKGDIVYIQGLIKDNRIYNKEWQSSFLQVCNNKQIAWKCISGLMVYEK
jgi:hypothetical protein